MIKELEYLDLDMNMECLLDVDGVYGILKKAGTQAAIRCFSADITWTHYLHPVLGSQKYVPYHIVATGASRESFEAVQETGPTIQLVVLAIAAADPCRLLAA